MTKCKCCATTPAYCASARPPARPLACLQGEFCSQGVRESLVVSFIKFVCQSSRQFCESAGDRGGSTPPALLLLLSRLCLDYETSTISYILTLTDEQFLVQVTVHFEDS